MPKAAHPLGPLGPLDAGISVSRAALSELAAEWLADGRANRHSPHTLAKRRAIVDRLLWFLKDRELEECDRRALREYLAYLAAPHPEGRWGRARRGRRAATGAAKGSTCVTHHGALRTFFNWCVELGALEDSPLRRIRAPICRPDQILPFEPEQLLAMEAAAKRGPNAARDRAIVLMLLDTGARVSELCGIMMGDLSLTGRRVTVLGKGGKRRALPFGVDVSRALWRYVREERKDAGGGAPLFLCTRGCRTGEALTRSGVQQLVERLAKAAGVDGVRASPHTFRHTFAITFLRGGGDVFTLKELLGHTSLAMVNRYLALAQADLANQHRRCSPADRLREAARGR